MVEDRTVGQGMPHNAREVDQMDIQLSDVTLHIDEALDKAQRAEVERQLRALDGVVSVHNPDNRPHLAVVEYNPAKVNASQLLATVRSSGVHAELIGL
jgi:hypothetical protein